MFKELNPAAFGTETGRDVDPHRGRADFVFIRQQTGATAGNLSGYSWTSWRRRITSKSKKTFRGKMPCTVCRITDTGRDAFAEYVAALQTYIKR